MEGKLNAKVEETIIVLCDWIKQAVEGYTTAEELIALPAVVQSVAALYETTKDTSSL
ncbi:hypothetical protein ACE3MQ_19955 [Paenibacillus lentus]|uniref:hypothetical protein n=1 Tax=Paenibacillus lentus TaxID=1338368 RepID=UPI0036594BBC